MKITMSEVLFLEAGENIYCSVSCFIKGTGGESPQIDNFVTDDNEIEKDSHYFCDECGAMISV